MKANKIFAGMLVALGFGSVVGLGSGCAHRASKSKTADNQPAETQPAADSTTVRDGGEVPIRVMYGVPPARFEPAKRIRETK